MKIIITEMKNPMNRLSINLDTDKERINKTKKIRKKYHSELQRK